MADEIDVTIDEDLVEVHATGKLTRQMYEDHMPRLNEVIDKYGSLRILFFMKDFQGWSADGLWEDIKFESKHGGDISRLAIVGELRWHAGMAEVCNMFTSATVKYFDPGDLEVAREWIAADPK
ncbi:SpoIIAA family protein [Stratiformator vulcanicus]|uniref:SpoIIAA-like protein n=1 Tax=Stratiformator vulcanicus TaxID=2527980 RepID=A0A517R048_9PLAN|nr:STAS/SEC14 domain-containing protein [Stratiformator vulcanicus]QDT37272.1 hypothetical protein Pan189_16450 [Stratiformator vulcanicus]